MPARKRQLGNPMDNHEDQSILDADVGSSGDGDGDGGAGGSVVPAPSSSAQNEEIRLEEEEEEKPNLEMTDVEQPQQNTERGGDDDVVKELPCQEVMKNNSECDAGNGHSSPSSDHAEDDKTEYILVELADIRKEVQCPICLGIIRKTRTVMDCLHRFCRECIDRSMRLGNNECPACRTHCASRRSLRDDPNYDALIAALYPDIDKYEEEELALHEEELLRNKKIQAYISETFQRQSEALGRRRTSVKSADVAFMRRSQRTIRGRNGYSRGRSSARSAAAAAVIGGSVTSDNEEEINDGNEEGNEAPEQSPEPGRQKRCRRWAPGRAQLGSERTYDEPEEVTNREMLAWGKNGVRSQTRHGSLGGSSGKSNRVDRISRLVDHLHSLDEHDDDFDLHLRLVPAEEDGRKIPGLERAFLSCRPTLSIKQLAQFVALQTSVEADDVEILVAKDNRCREYQTLEDHQSLGCIQSFFSSPPFDLVLAYRASQRQSEGRARSPPGEGPPAGQYDFL